MRYLPSLWIIIFFAACIGDAAAQTSLSALIGNAQQWSSFNWSLAPQSTVWQDARWSTPEHTGEASFEDRASLSFTIASQQVLARTYTDRSQQIPSYKLQVTADGLVGCETLRGWGTRAFGQPVRRDASYTLAFGSTPDTQLRMVDELAQWSLGNTTATLVCVGTAPMEGNRPEGTIAALTFQPASIAERLIPLVAIRCEGNEPDQTPVVLVLDEHRHGVRRGDLSPLTSEAIFTEGTVQFSVEGEHEPSVYTIDRLTGVLIGRTGNVTLRWRCDRTELGQRRF